MEGKLHIYHPGRHLNVLEFTPLPATETPTFPLQTPPNILLFVGGLFDNFGTPAYVSDLAKLFPRHNSQKWTVMHVQLSSAMRGWGYSDLNRDIDEIGTCISYIRKTIRSNQPTNIVLMGHSTGCQDTVHYLYSPNPTKPESQARPAVQGAILQAPVSDREAVLQEINAKLAVKAQYDRCVDLASRTPKNEWPSTLINTSWISSLFWSNPLSISRFWSLTSPDSPQNPSMDDLFSSDLTDQHLTTTFGRIYTNNLLQSPPPSVSATAAGEEDKNSAPPQMLILISDADGSMPPSIDKPQLLERWSSALESAGGKARPAHPRSTCIPNANHDISGSDSNSRRARLVDLCSAVVHYLSDVVGEIDESTYQVLDENERNLIGLEFGEGMDEKLEKMKL